MEEMFICQGEKKDYGLRAQGSGLKAQGASAFACSYGGTRGAGENEH
ncbi:MAG: hypothetical protein JW927_11050 [Deltaproteobacteria bacterium]|nr:hypothetical protein [Deltaproteobacteria bacterium]